MMFSYFNPTKSISLSSCLTLLRYDYDFCFCICFVKNSDGFNYCSLFHVITV